MSAIAMVDSITATAQGIVGINIFARWISYLYPAL